MASKFVDDRALPNGVSISTEFKDITVAMLRTICHRFPCPRGRNTITKRKLYDTILSLPEDVQNAIIVEARTAISEGRWKHKRNVEVQDPDIGVASQEGNEVSEGGGCDTTGNAVEELIDSNFMRAPTRDTLNALLCNFIDRTSQNSVSVVACAVCAQETSLSNVQRRAIKDIENQHLLRPLIPHPKHDIYNTMLLHPAGVDADTANICGSCATKLHQCKLPKFALANNMWIGEVPPQLSMLSFPERILIARYFPCAYIFKLYPKTKNARHWKDPKLYRALKGNVSTYRLDPNQVAHMVHPTIMPPPPAILASTIGITFLGPTGVPEKSMPAFFRVQRQRILDALRLLKAENPLYSDIEISEENLNLLPIDGVPEELMAITKHTADVELFNTEGQGYVPRDVEEDLDEAITPPVDDEVGNDQAFDMHEDGECSAPTIVPLQALGVIDIDGLEISDSEIMAHAMANSAIHENPNNFTVKRGSAFVNEYARVDERTGLRFDGGPSNANHLLGCFPTLFPYGQGGFEIDRPVKVPYENHVQWALQYFDKRFRKDPHFPFQVFGVCQKRQVCRSAVLQMKKSTFLQQEARIMHLTQSDLIEASREETAKMPFSNPGVRALRKQLSAIRTRVSGTDESRHATRSKIWGTNLAFNPPNLWITLNPPDTHDPIAQVMAGADINLDDFINTLGPDHGERAENVTNDPFASAKYFHFVIKTIIEELFGIKKMPVGRPARKEGIYGNVKAYIGTVEAQGRGSLHLHIILWLENAPNSKVMQEALHSAAFRSKLTTYVDSIIRADINQRSTEELKGMKKLPGLSYSRPLDPRRVDDVQREEFEVQLARSLQLHDCSQDTCYKIVKGQLKCKRGVPFHRAMQTWVEENGDWGPKRYSANLNAWTPTTMQAMRGNQDTKVIMNGAETNSLTWYITNYATKKQQNSSNVSALLAKSPAFVDKNRKKAKEANKKLIQSCANTLTRDREFSAAEIMSLLMGWGDRYESHVYAPIYLDSMVRALRMHFDCLHQGLSRIVDSNEQDESMQTIRVIDGKLTLKDQMKDYRTRSDNMAEMSFLDFQLDTYEKSLPSETQQNNEGDEYGPDNIIPDAPAPIVGRPPHRREVYKEEAEKSRRIRVFRASGHETCPRIVGRWIERSDDPGSREIYCATMLSLLKPWVVLDDLKRDFDTFDQSWKAFSMGMSKRASTFTANVDYYYECLDGAAARRTNPIKPTYEEVGFEHEGGEDENTVEYEQDLEDDYMPIAITEIDVEYARNRKHTDNDRLMATTAMNIAEELSLFECTTNAPLRDFAINATPDIMQSIEVWNTELKTTKRKRASDSTDVPAIVAGTAPQIEEQRPQKRRRTTVEPTIDIVHDPVEDPSEMNKVKACRPIYSKLKPDQRRAHDIVNDVLIQHIGRKDTEQLLMLILGEGGTGKSLVIDAITETFAFHNQSDILAKCGTSGIAASNINGQTIHSWAGIGVRTSSSENWYEKAAVYLKRRRVVNILGVEVLILDELSMLTNTLLYYLSEVIGMTRGSEGKGDPSKPFGGMHVILCGDFHQFPPVAAANDALFTHGAQKSTRSTIGNNIYRQFKTVVILKEQMRVTDQGWNDILNRLRVGECTVADLQELRKLVLTNPDCAIPDFKTEPWNSCILITPRHAVRERWNSEAIRKHCRETGNLLYVTPAEDTEGKSVNPLSMFARKLVAAMNEKQTGKLPEILELAIGMRVMITANVSTEADIANGTQGIITDIILDTREPPLIEEGGEVHLKYPPAMIMFKPNKATEATFAGVEAGLVPLVAAKSTFSLNVGSKKSPKKINVQRRHFQLTAAYSFTDIKSQGQTLGSVIVDIGKSFALTPFNVYVALSRSRGRHTIRLLRDFKEELFIKHPNEDLRLEMQRLEGLNVVTKAKYVERLNSTGHSIY